MEMMISQFHFWGMICFSKKCELYGSWNYRYLQVPSRNDFLEAHCQVNIPLVVNRFTCDNFQFVVMAKRFQGWLLVMFDSFYYHKSHLDDWIFCWGNHFSLVLIILYKWWFWRALDCRGKNDFDL